MYDKSSVNFIDILSYGDYNHDHLKSFLREKSCNKWTLYLKSNSFIFIKRNNPIFLGKTLRIFLFAIFLLSRIFSYADSATENKFWLIEEAENSKQQAVKALEDADNMRYYIPDLGKREHMHAIITSAIPALAISDIRLKILTVGLALIGSLSVDMYDKYIEYRVLLLKAAHHLEMANFYSSLSVKFTNLTDDGGNRAFMKAIDCLSFCDTLSFLIGDDLYIGFGSQDLKCEISYRILEYRDYFIKEFKKHNGKIPIKLSKICFELYENLDEILYETHGFENRELHYKIRDYIEMTMKYLKLAEKFWGIN